MTRGARPPPIEQNGAMELSRQPSSDPPRQGRLIVICGLPGSGKTTLARQLCTDGSAIRMCPDEWMESLGVNLWDGDVRARIEALQWDITQGLLVHGATVVIEWGTWGRDERDLLRMRSRELNAAVELRYLSVDVDELWSRVSARAMEDPAIRRQDVVNWFTAFQSPDDAELRLFD